MTWADGSRSTTGKDGTSGIPQRVLDNNSQAETQLIRDKVRRGSNWWGKKWSGGTKMGTKIKETRLEKAVGVGMCQSYVGEPRFSICRRALKSMTCLDVSQNVHAVLQDGKWRGGK